LAIGDKVLCPVCSSGTFQVRRDGMVVCRDCGNFIGQLNEKSMEYKPFKQ